MNWLPGRSRTRASISERLTAISFSSRSPNACSSAAARRSQRWRRQPRNLRRTARIRIAVHPPNALRIAAACSARARLITPAFHTVHSSGDSAQGFGGL
nr:hypothetical protein [Bradyrhizobium prioritasuperba]